MVIASSLMFDRALNAPLITNIRTVKINLRFLNSNQVRIHSEILKTKLLSNSRCFRKVSVAVDILSRSQDGSLFCINLEYVNGH